MLFGGIYIESCLYATSIATFPYIDCLSQGMNNDCYMNFIKSLKGITKGVPIGVPSSLNDSNSR